MKTALISNGISTKETHSAIELAVDAALACVTSSGIDMQEVDYLIHTGVHRDNNIVEPSIASLVQKGIGLNLDYIKYPVNRAAFSMDLMNGNSGVINAFQVGDSLIKAGRAVYVLITSSDAHPSKEHRDEFPFSPMGGAILLGRSATTGFDAFTFKHSQSSCPGSETYVDVSVQQLNAKFDITIKVDPNFEDRLLELASSTAECFLKERGITPEEVVLIPSQPSRRFVAALGVNLSIPAEARMILPDALRDAATSNFALGLDLLAQRRDLSSVPYVLFVGASAGLHCGCALYKR